VPQPAVAESRPTAAQISGPHREAWLLEQPATSYTLQLLGSRKEDSIDAFISRHRLDPDKSAWYRTRYKNDDWYVLVYGIYPDRQSAIGDRDRLPAVVRE
jgi:DamX protein